MRLQDKTAIVTGGASGFGAGIVKHFAAAGARVLLTDRDAGKGERAALPAMKAQNSGVIINTASGIALTPRPNLVTYAATKGAVVTFTKGLAMELAEFGIRVNALCPAAGDTPMLAEFMGGKDTAENRAKYMAGIPLGKLVTGDDMGAAATYLASDEAGMITGTCLAVDGGRCI